MVRKYESIFAIFSTFLFFSGEAQIALPDYQEPSMIPAHIVIFDNDTLGVLFLELRSMSLYSRVKEDLTACHFEDVRDFHNETQQSNTVPPEL